MFDLLTYLIRNRDSVVSKDDLIEAIWKGRIVSEAALTTRLNVARTAIGDSGEQQRLIKTLPRKGFRFIGVVREEPASQNPGSPEFSNASGRPAPALPDKPSIAVLPFSNLSADSQQEYFADGVVEDIIAALSRLRWLFVIARNSSFVYKGKSVDIKQVGRELGVRYVLEGSIRKSSERLRIASQLIDTATGASLSANRFEGALGDVFELQDRVTESVVGAIAPQLEQAEIVRAQRKTQNLDAYDYYLRGLAAVYMWTNEFKQRGVAAVRHGDRDRSEVCRSIRQCRALLQLARHEWLDDRPNAGAWRSATARALRCGCGEGRRGRTLDGRLHNGASGW